MTSAATLKATTIKSQDRIESPSCFGSSRPPSDGGESWGPLHESSSSTCIAPRTVGFDTFSVSSSAASKCSEFSGMTLRYKHPEYAYNRLSRTSLVGVDTDEFSESALQYFLEELVEDGDEVICLRAIDPKTAAEDDFVGSYTYSDSDRTKVAPHHNSYTNFQRISSCQDQASKSVSATSSERTSLSSFECKSGKRYREEAQRFFNQIIDKNTKNKHISIVLEFAVGEIFHLIRRMIEMYQPCVLVLGTRGKPVEGFRGLLPGSVSKYCLQHSPIPVIVVRPEQKRAEIKSRRRKEVVHRASYRRVLLDSMIHDYVKLIPDGATGKKLPPTLPEHVLTPNPLSPESRTNLLSLPLPSIGFESTRSRSPSQVRSSRPHTPLGRLFKF